MRVKVFVCPKCESGIFTRTLKDFRPCTCNAMAVSGLPETPRLSAGARLAPKIKLTELNIKASPETLEEDWASMTDEFGFVPKGDARLKGAKAIKPDDLIRYAGSQEQTRPEGRDGEDAEDGDDDESGPTGIVEEEEESGEEV
jgi:hypothetical protein